MGRFWANLARRQAPEELESDELTAGAVKKPGDQPTNGTAGLGTRPGKSHGPWARVFDAGLNHMTRVGCFPPGCVTDLDQRKLGCTTLTLDHLNVPGGCFGQDQPWLAAHEGALAAKPGQRWSTPVEKVSIYVHLSSSSWLVIVLVGSCGFLSLLK